MTRAAAPESDGARYAWLVPTVFAVAVLIRIATVLALPKGLAVDTDRYRGIAISLRESGVYGVPAESDSVGARIAASRVQPTAYRPPLYPLLLSGLVREGTISARSVAALHVVLGVATVGLVFWLAKSWGFGRSAALAALLVACDPILLYQSAQIMTETLAAFLTAVCLVCLTRLYSRGPALPTRTAEDFESSRIGWWALVAGLAIGLASLCRPTFLPWGGLLAGSVLLWPPRKSNRAKAVTALLLGLAIALAPWGWRNYAQFGQLKLTTTHGGYTLLLGNNPSFYRFLREDDWGAVWKSDELDRAWQRRGSLRDAQSDLFGPADERSTALQRTEFEDDQLAYAYAKRFIRSEPSMFAWSCLVRLGRFWNVLPHQTQENESLVRWLMRWSTAFWYLLVYALCGIAILQLRRRLLAPPWLWGILLCVTFTMVHTFFWSDMRMRAPLVPFISLLAGSLSAGRAMPSRCRQSVGATVPEAARVK